ncbi:hypothetical protein [Bradyrhizobium sp. SRS-191]|uniref:hypothetical protein n=1 Tax=Bradyrhizobium sp. SRS-191 TaxID=2962606 RepID=UPI00211E227E|nr:hypothetical protein [Bradyrhizobium sp. SRS-191]
MKFRNGEAEYFRREDWTGQTSLSGFTKSGSARAVFDELLVSEPAIRITRDVL